MHVYARFFIVQAVMFLFVTLVVLPLTRVADTAHNINLQMKYVS